MRAKSVARKLANSININTDNDNGNDNGNGNVNIGTSLAYKGKVLELQLFYLHHGTVATNFILAGECQLAFRCLYLT